MSGLLDRDNLHFKLMDSAFESIVIFDRMGAITYGNKKALTGLGFEDIVNVQISRLLPGVFSIDKDGFHTEYPLDGTVFDGQIYRQNMTCYRIHGMVNKLSDAEYMLRFYDISRIEGLEKEINSVKENTSDIDQIKNEFVANVTHELRTPVNGILGNTHELMSHEMSPEDLGILKMIERGCEDMNALINNILDFSKLEAGKFQLEPREFNFRNMIEYVRTNHINKIHEKGLEFFVTVSGDIPETVIGDELRIVQILNNLLSNATKFTHVGKVMMEAVATAVDGNKVEIFFMIMDTGIGIDKKNQDKLFKSFSQVEASISRRFGGTGLGLNISKQLVDLMGGHINVESEVGKGTTFNFSVWLELPENNKDISISTVAPLSFGMDEDLQRNMERTFGTDENIKEINNRLTKLSLCLEMGNWEKAENFSDAIKALADGAPKEVASQVLRLKMAVQKEHKEKALTAIDNVRDILSNGIKPLDGE